MESEIIKAKIEEYLKLLADIKAKTGDERTALSILQEVNKDLRMAQIRVDRENGNGNGDDRPATDRQKDYLRKLGVKIPANVTKKQASSLIDEALEKESEQDSSQKPVKSGIQSISIPWYALPWDEKAAKGGYVVNRVEKGASYN